MITFNCGGCGYKYTVDKAYAGKKGRCKRCNRINVIPMPQVPEDITPQIDQPLRLVPDPVLDNQQEVTNDTSANRTDVFSPPGRTVSLPVIAVLFITAIKLYIAIALLAGGFLIAARPSDLTAIQRIIVIIPGMLLIAFHIYQCIRNIILLRNGIHTLGQVSRIHENKFRFSDRDLFRGRYHRPLFDPYYFKTYSIEYRFYDEDSNPLYGEIVTTRPGKVTDEQYEVMFYNRNKPRSILLLDSLPGKMYLDKNGGVRIGGYLSVAVTLMSIATVFAVIYYVINKLLQDAN